MREKLVIIADTSKKMFHFTSTKLAGSCNEAWYPYVEGEIFKYVERYLVESKIALNVTSVEKLRTCGLCEDYQVTYNAENRSRMIVNGIDKNNEPVSVIAFADSIEDGYKQFWEGITDINNFDTKQQLSSQFLDTELKRIA